MTEKPSKRRVSKITKKQLQLRNKLWPDLNEQHLWLRLEKDGFTTIPRTLPIIGVIMDRLSKNKPVSMVYFELWCRAYDECFVTLSKHQEYSMHSGFTGQRAVNTWRERIRILAQLGFIDVKPGPSGEISYALIYNPYRVIKQHKLVKNLGLSDDLYNTLMARAIDIGADDFDEEETC